MQAGPKRAEQVAPSIDPVTKLPTSHSLGDLAYAIRAGEWNKGEHMALGSKLRERVTVGEAMPLTDNPLPLSQVFHAHCFFAKGRRDYAEVKLGTNWVVLRILNDKKGVTSDGLHWVVNMAEQGADYPLDQDIFLQIDFEQPVPAISAWPRKEMFHVDD
jgi:hypothetical protein